MKTIRVQAANRPISQRPDQPTARRCIQPLHQSNQITGLETEPQSNENHAGI